MSPPLPAASAQSDGPRWATGVLLLALGVLFAGCPDDTRLRRTLPPDVRVDTYQQQSASKIDVLWVVDNSGSMAERQANLARNFGAFIDVFGKSAVDYRIAVITTDIFSAKDQGQFRGNPKVLSPKTANVAAAFASNIKVGIDGSPYEAGLAAAEMALVRQQQTNAPKLAQIATCQDGCGKQSNPLACLDACPNQFPVEFLRPDAYLYLIFVTDEEDRSSADVRYYWRSFETAKGIGNDGTVTTAAIMGDVPQNGCGATPGKRYQALSQLTGGEVGSICDTEFARTLKKLATNAVGLKRKFALGKAPNVETLQVRVRYPCGASQETVKACASVARDECEGQSADAYGTVCTPVQGGPDGWTYEPANRVVFFAGEAVPGIGSQVELQYYEEGKP